jgi:hypothetical protein
MGDETNGDNRNRLDRIEELLEVLVNEHIQFHEEHRQLLKAQVLLYDATQKLTEAQTDTNIKIAQAQADTNSKLAELAEAQKHTDENLAALINVVDSLMRRPPPQ